MSMHLDVMMHEFINSATSLVNNLYLKMSLHFDLAWHIIKGTRLKH